MQKLLAVCFREEVCPAPFIDQLGYLLLVFLVHPPLLGSHRHEQVLVCALRHLQGHLLLRAADEPFTGSLAHLIKILIADHLAAIVGHDAVGAELPVGAEAIVVGKLHHGIEFLELVLQRRA